MDILYLVDRLENLVSTSRHMPLVNQIIIKEGDILALIDQMRANIPDEIKQARRIVQERDRILAQAQADANIIIQNAHHEVERAVDEALQRGNLLKAAEERAQDLMRLATEQAQMIVQRAETQSDRLRIEADAYVVERLRAMHEQLISLETTIGHTILSVEKGLETLQHRPNLPTTELVRPHPDEVEDDEYMEEEEDVDLEQLDESLPEEPVANQPPVIRPRMAAANLHPRRSSLAADTMGI